MANELQRVDTLIKEHKDSEAREILLQIVGANPSNDEAWVWLASITPDRETRQRYLEEALKHNPRNQIAQRTLQKMTAPVTAKTATLPSASQPEKLSTMVHVLCGWPLILVFIGGAIGGALGGVAYATNLAIYKSDMPGVVKVILNPVIGVAAIVLWYVIAKSILR